MATIVDTNEAPDANVPVITGLSVLIIVGPAGGHLPTSGHCPDPAGHHRRGARGAVALLGERGLPVSTYTAAFLTAIVLGAGGCKRTGNGCIVF